MQVGTAYRITGPDGTRIVVGNCDAAREDPDWIGWLEPDNGIQISRPVKESADDAADADGGYHGSFFRGRATIVMNIKLDPNAAIATLNSHESRLKRAVRAYSADGALVFAPEGFGDRAYWFRANQDPLLAGRRPKTAQLQLISARAYALSPNESEVRVVPGAIGGEIGFSFPLVFPLGFAFAQSAQSTINNAGDAPTWPRFRIDGPITNPVILNNTTGDQLAFVYTLAAGQWLDVYSDPQSPAQIILNGTTDRYSALDRPNSRWWQLEPGLNDVRILASAYSAGAGVTVHWRDAWD